ncbi:maleylpyruvate isomerase N-terminal domain-containing protein [Pseudarthrobacter albicanus]|uniref:maleylpyruvate isomerase N-terminal domain-containing protein n=1 Tax=Pseudarthrobacter albicanus TaxID=2823873 RepID=UPI001BADCD12|nr:maleylpyruvate isomerase N-terminal domain-containing protein [Pseudarthrobacter albicanus]
MDADRIKSDFLGAAAAFLELIGRVPESAWSQPALGEWDVRGLTGHASRALTTVETYLDASAAEPAAGKRVDGPVAYYLAVRGSTTPDAIAQRGREAGAGLGEDPVATVQELVRRVTALVRHTPDEALAATPAGTMTLIDYLPTRTFELAVHGLDLARALGFDSPASLAPAIAASLELAGAIGARLPSAPELLLLLTGRSGLPNNLSVV